MAWHHSPLKYQEIYPAMNHWRANGLCMKMQDTELMGEELPSTVGQPQESGQLYVDG